MNRRIVVAIAGGSLTLGIVVGAAGAVAVRDATSPAVTNIAAQLAAMNDMHQAMAGQMGTEMASLMTQMMGSGMMGGGMMGSGHMKSGPMDPGSGMELHPQHHPDWP
jgi:hypothetical protein